MSVCLAYDGSVNGDWVARYVVKRFAAIWNGVWVSRMSKRPNWSSLNWLTTSLASV